MQTRSTRPRDSDRSAVPGRRDQLRRLHRKVIMTLVYLDDRFLLHQTGNHPESAQRLKTVHAALKLKENDGFAATSPHAAVPASDQDLTRVHSVAYLDQLEQFSSRGGGRIETDTVVGANSVQVARLAAGTCVNAMERVVAGEHSNALCLVRPPGHHALPHAAMGFCLLSNAAITARTAIERLQLNRVLIVDWDVHHGNGTQDVFYEDERVTVFSAHRYPFYPGSGRVTETGRGSALGTTWNLPLPFGTTRHDYLSAFENMLTRAADACRPDLVIVSAGFDAHAADPVGSLGLESEDFDPLTRLVRQVAQTHCDGRLVSLLEGGYHPEKLAECVLVHLNALSA